MKAILMNKNTEVLVVDYNTKLNRFDKVEKVININYAPLILKSYYEIDNDELELLKRLEEWFKGRGIPSWRDKLDLLLQRLNIETPAELLDKAFGLSLSDQYWIKPYNSNIKHEDINFFDHDFDASEFVEATFSNANFIIKNGETLKTPNNTTDGMLKKAWIIEDGTRYLLKGGYKNELLQPFNEVLATMICERLGFKHVPYTLDTYKNTVVSKCPCFINKDTEFVTAYQILHNNIKEEDKNNAYEIYIKLLDERKIDNVREKIENMYILDFLIMNEDRHLNNFGIIRDVNTLEWLDVAPIFDNGQSLNLSYYSDEVMAGEGRLFYNVEKFDKIIDVVKDITRIDVSRLKDLPEEFDKLLHRYQNITGMSDKRIHTLCVLLNKQINKLKEIEETNN